MSLSVQESRLKVVRRMADESAGAVEKWESSFGRLSLENRGNMGDKANDVLHVRIS